MVLSGGGDLIMNVTIYVNGKKVRREDLSNIEITNEAVKRMLAEKLSGKDRQKESA